MNYKYLKLEGRLEAVSEGQSAFQSRKCFCNILEWGLLSLNMKRPCFLKQCKAMLAALAIKRQPGVNKKLCWLSVFYHNFFFLMKKRGALLGEIKHILYLPSEILDYSHLL